MFKPLTKTYQLNAQPEDVARELKTRVSKRAALLNTLEDYRFYGRVSHLRFRLNLEIPRGKWGFIVESGPALIGNIEPKLDGGTLVTVNISNNGGIVASFLILALAVALGFGAIW